MVLNNPIFQVIYLSIHLFIYLYIPILHIYLPNKLAIKDGAFQQYITGNLSIYLSIHLSIFLSIYNLYLSISIDILCIYSTSIHITNYIY